MRVTSAFWVSAFIRQCMVENVYAAIRCKGAAEAGAIWIVLDDMEGTLFLFSPAPMAFAPSNTSLVEHERCFIEVMQSADSTEISAQLDKERRFDRDLWVIDVESRGGKHSIPLGEQI